MRPPHHSTVNRVFQALGDPTRRAIVERLGAGPASASRLAAMLAISVTAVGQHMQVLEKSGLAVTEKVGCVRMCRVDSSGFAALESWVAYQRMIWERKLDRLGEVLDS